MIELADKLRRWFIVKLGGYTTQGFATIEDAINEIDQKQLSEKYDLLTRAVKRLFNTIGADDILRDKEGTWMYGPKPLTPAEKELLIAEAKQFVNMKLWQVLQADVKYQANKAMFIDGVSKDDIVAGKLWLYTLDTLNTRLKSLAKGVALFNSK